MNPDTVQSLLGWALIFNYGVLLVWYAIYQFANRWIVQLHARMFDIEPAVVRRVHFQLMGQFKLLVFVLVLAPWLALLILNR